MIEYKEFLLTKEESIVFHKNMDELIKDGIPIDDDLFSEVVEKSKKIIKEQTEKNPPEKKKIMRKPTLIKKINSLHEENKITNEKKLELMNLIETKKYSKVRECFEELDKEKIVLIERGSVIEKIYTLYQEDLISVEQKIVLLVLLEYRKYNMVLNFLRGIDEEMKILLDSANKK